MISKARISLLASLSRRDRRVEEGLYLIEGMRIVREALQSRAPAVEILATESFLAERTGGDLAALAGERGVPVERISRRDLERLADTRTPQGVLAVVRRSESDPEVVRRSGLFLVLDGVADPGNVGTLVRTADAFGARAVLAGPGTADFENPKVLRAAMGSTFHVPVMRAENLDATLTAFRGTGAEILAATLMGADLYETRPGGDRLVVILGNEARGISRDVLRHATREVTVPCPGRAESLNVAMAGAILLSHLARGMAT